MINKLIEQCMKPSWGSVLTMSKGLEVNLRQWNRYSDAKYVIEDIRNGVLTDTYVDFDSFNDVSIRNQIAVRQINVLRVVTKLYNEGGLTAEIIQESEEPTRFKNMALTKESVNILKDIEKKERKKNFPTFWDQLPTRIVLGIVVAFVVWGLKVTFQTIFPEFYTQIIADPWGYLQSVWINFKTYFVKC